jgi:hypothetical protein
VEITEAKRKPPYNVMFNHHNDKGQLRGYVLDDRDARVWFSTGAEIPLCRMRPQRLRDPINSLSNGQVQWVKLTAPASSVQLRMRKAGNSSCWSTESIPCCPLLKSYHVNILITSHYDHVLFRLYFVRIKILLSVSLSLSLSLCLFLTHSHVPGSLCS